jgi:hypothetical protein
VAIWIFTIFIVFVKGISWYLARKDATLAIQASQIALELVVNNSKLFGEMLLLTQAFLTQGDFSPELLQIETVLIAFSSPLVLISLFKFLELPLFLFLHKSNLVTRFVELLSQVINQTCLLILYLARIRSILIKTFL